MWLFFFFNDTATTEIYTLSLHDALPISPNHLPFRSLPYRRKFPKFGNRSRNLSLPRNEHQLATRSEEHTSELQSRPHLVCRLLLEKKKALTLHYSSVFISNVRTKAAIVH